MSIGPAMREPTLLILSSLANGPMHGYGIIRAVEAASDDRVRLRAGTMYGALDRLVDEGLAAVDREEVEQGRLRRYYRLTEDGATALRAEVARMEANLGYARRGLGLIGPSA